MLIQDIAKVGSQPPAQVGATETYSKNLLGPVFFTLCNLRFAGAGDMATDKTPAPEQNNYIVAEDEEYTVSVDVEFSHNPLTSLLLCLGMKVDVCFSFESIGQKGEDLDITESIVTKKGVYTYTVTHTGKPGADGFGNTFYAGAATATVNPPDHPCAPNCPFGFGYLATVLVHVYPRF
ncbi:MAG: hypothetical protein AAFR31_05155 [Cyanobacteria bacterium J06627_8]